ncbi:response regulator [bacterium]|nr:response regulator [bacterium]
MDILIVEDSVRERERLETLFGGLGYTVSSCDSVAEAEQIFAKESIRCAILDIGLTDRSGSVLFQLLKDSQPGCEIIIFTGNPSPYLKQRFIKEGAVAYVVKGSEGASGEAFHRLIENTIGAPASSGEMGDGGGVRGTPLLDFLREHISPPHQGLFFDTDGGFPPCPQCGSREYLVTFSQELQAPPLLKGKVLCAECSHELDPTLADGEE